jgi:hypothetical protein
MTTGNMSDCICHGENRQSKSESDTDKTDAEIWETRGEYSTATAAKYQPERSEEFCCCTSTECHGFSPELSSFIRH